MAKTEPSNLDGAIDALEGDVKTVRAADTAYTVDNAADYDAKRIVAPCDQKIHAAERAILLWALRHTTKDAKILEVGCGTGRLLTEGLDEGYLIDGVDGSGAMLEHLKEKLTDQQSAQLELIVAHAADIPRPDQCYDLVYSIRLLNQTESPEYALTVIDEIARLVKPGGYFLIECVNAARPQLGKSRRQTTRLSPAQIAERGRAAGAMVVSYRGAYLLSMQAYKKCPEPFLGVLALVDQGLSRCLPRLCSRAYVMFRKAEG